MTTEEALERRPRDDGSLPGYGLVPVRSFVVAGPRIWMALHPGDRPLVAAGDAVMPGAPIAERFLHVAATELRSSWIENPATAHPGTWLSLSGEGRSRRALEGELLYPVGDRWCLAVGTNPEIVEAPAPGIVREVRPGLGIAIGLSGAGVPGSLALGATVRGRLVLGAGEVEARSAVFDVSQAGSIVVTPARVDAEAITRARAMGLRGLVVSGLGDREQRDFIASEARQHAGIHRPPAFGVLVLDGAVRRALATPVRTLIGAAAGRDAAIVGEPPMLVLAEPVDVWPTPPAGYVRVRGGAFAGREGTWIGLAGRHRFRSGVLLEAASIRIEDGSAITVPLGDLERLD